jgi:anthranilate phosphoribosyltransferase
VKGDIYDPRVVEDARRGFVEYVKENPAGEWRAQAESIIAELDASAAERMLASLRIHGSIKAWVVHGNGLDELTTTGTSTVLALEDDQVRSFTVDPVALGLAPAIMAELVGGEPAENAEAVRRMVAGQHGPHRNIVVLNAGAALVVAGRAQSLDEGVALAAQSIDSGAAAATLQRFIDESQEALAEVQAGGR